MKKCVKRTLTIVCPLVLLLAIGGAILLSSIFGASGNTRFFSGYAAEYRQNLIDQGFPEDYASALTELHLLHPAWEFEPLLISQEEPTYTWSYVNKKETENPETNLISAADTYKAYRHPTNRELYDSGYYQASPATVAYFMDPRNFLNECDIFQFFDLSSGAETPVAAVEAVLAGTFMENATLENGMTYAAYFCALGQELGVHPVYLAVKVRQEQGGAGTSPVISGTCGDLLWDYYKNQTETTTGGSQILPPSEGHTEEELKALNGHYNMMNVGAGGKGVFQIYLGAMNRAVKGTEDMSGIWGSPSWNTKWKSIYGGAHVLKESYIDAYQSTIYLQKFNVDSRAGSKNFWKQYMQAIGGGMTEGRSLYASFAATGALDSPCKFLIPVYSDMPSSPAPDPAGGNCAQLAVATERYEYGMNLSSPQKITAQNETLYANTTGIAGQMLSLTATVSHSYGVSGIEYRWDSGEWQTLTPDEKIKIDLPVNFLKNTEHILLVRTSAAYDHENSLKKSSRYVLSAVIYVEVIPPPEADVTIEVANTSTTERLEVGTTVTLPVCEVAEFAGWLCSNGELLPSGGEFVLEKNTTCRAIFLNLIPLRGASISLSGDITLRYYSVLDDKSFDALQAAEVLSPGSIRVINAESKTPAKPILTGEYTYYYADTAPISPKDYNTEFLIEFAIEITYQSGEKKYIQAPKGDSRTPMYVAQAALSDSGVYTPEEEAFLKNITTK